MTWGRRSTKASWPTTRRWARLRRGSSRRPANSKSWGSPRTKIYRSWSRLIQFRDRLRPVSKRGKSMTNEQRMVAEFHRLFGIAIGTVPAAPDGATRSLRVNLIREEFDELQQALAQHDVSAIAKELADLLYVVYGTAVSCGIDLE